MQSVATRAHGGTFLPQLTAQHPLIPTHAGHYLGTGKPALVYLQNSGLGNIINPILSLAVPEVYSIPMLLLIGWRGEPGKKDEPQHLVQGMATPSLLATLNVPFQGIALRHRSQVRHEDTCS